MSPRASSATICRAPRRARAGQRTRGRRQSRPALPRPARICGRSTCWRRRLRLRLQHAAVVPRVRRRALAPGGHAPHHAAGRALWELPLSTLGSLLGLSLPIARRNYFRQLPHALMKPRFGVGTRRTRRPSSCTSTSGSWTPSQPRIDGGSFLTGFATTATSTRWKRVRDYFRDAPYAASPSTSASIRPAAPAAAARPSRVRPAAGRARRAAAAREPGQRRGAVLQRGASLRTWRTRCAASSAAGRAPTTAFIFVDDGSRDDTWDALERLFGDGPRCSASATTEPGRRRGDPHRRSRAATEVVCSIDCDCTYDPHELAEDDPAADRGRRPGDGVALPSARAGCGTCRAGGCRCRGAPRSSTAGCCARSCDTYTSCFRVYRRSVVADLRLDEAGFLGVAEMLGKLDLNGAGSSSIRPPSRCGSSATRR